MTDTNQLLLDYANKGSESAFRELVTRYLDLVYSVALRRADGNVHTAEDIAQSVFTDLARKAGDLPPNILLGGWLHRHTGFVASTILRSEHRRQNRERQAAEMNSLNAAPDNKAWLQLGPVLDEAIDRLEAADREVIVLRYFERRDLRAVGAALGIGEDAAQKRVSRAVDKLRELVGECGVAITTTVLVAALAGSAVSAAPACLADSISNTALAAGVGAGFAVGLLKVLTVGKFKLALGATVLAVVALPWLIQKFRVVDSGPLPMAVIANSIVETRTELTDDTDSLAVNHSNAAAKSSMVKESGLLRLTIVSADGGQAIPTVPINYRRWDQDKFTGRSLQSTRFGVCEVSFPQETTTELELTTRLDGFADTRLHWRKDRGDAIPTEYTLRLERSVPIGGTVVDADGQPVAGAKVGFNHEDDPTSVKWPEDHEFGWIEVSTDQNGQWHINRMADEVIRRIYGSARHLEYVDSALLFLNRKREAETKLRAETYVFQLGRPVTIRGVVVDAAGMAVAGAAVLVGSRAESGKRTAQTAADGTFTVNGCRPGKVMVTAEANGYAATTIELTDAGQEPVRLVLQRGRALRLRVVNLAGQPISKASVWLDIFRNGPVNEPRPIAVQADFNPRTDDAGRVVWSNAPETELQFDIAARGYLRTNQFRVRPDDEEHVVLLAPAVVVSGRVTDATTGQPIPHFRIVCGWPNSNGTDNAGVNWSRFSRDWLTFTGGKYHHAFEDAMIHGGPNPGYALKFEAEGYASLPSRVIKAEEGEVQLDVALQPTITERYTVLLPDGHPAADAEVGLIAPGVRLELAPGRFNRENVQVGGSILMADKTGRFQLSADESIHTVIIVHPLGFLSLARGELTGQEFLQLQPWGRLEGAVTSGGQPASGKTFGLEFEGIQPADLWFGYTSFHVTSDPEGQFVFPQVPPGKLKLIRIIPFQTSPGSGGWSDKFERDVEVRPGETTQVTIGGAGYTVTARVRWPAGFDRNNLQHFVANVHTPAPTWMSDIAKDPQRAASMAQLPEVQAFQQSARQFQMASTADGILSAEDVPAGEFDLSIYAFLQNGESKTNLSGLTGRARITVPANPPTGTLDVGEIVLGKP